MIQRLQFLILFILFSQVVMAQKSSNIIHDTLFQKSFEELNQGANAIHNDSVKGLLYAKAWLEKAKEMKDFRQMSFAYKNVLYKNHKKLRIAYADSMVNAAKQTKEAELIGSAYMTKGIMHYDAKEQTKALDNFLLADKYIAQTKNQYQIAKVKYGIAQTKYYLGFYDEAISLFRECIDYFKDENDRAYLNSIHSLGLCYNKTGKFAWCTITNQLGIDEGQRLKDTEMEAYFIHSEGINLCSKKNYREAIKNLTMALPVIKGNKDFANESVAYFYIGKSYWSLNLPNKAIFYFKKVDQLFKSENYIRPDLREGYEKLISFYEDQNDTESQLIYINQLLKVDDLLNKNYNYLFQKIIKEYDTKELLTSKKAIEDAMAWRTIIGFCIIAILITIIAYLVIKQHQNKKRFEDIMKRDTSTPKIIHNANKWFDFEEHQNENSHKFENFENTEKLSTNEISSDLETTILKKLEKFEQTKKFLEKDMKLSKIASLLSTNTKYVTIIIAKHRGKGTIEYINDLKIDYIVEILKTETKYRNYTNKALGEEAGFLSTQKFTRAFKSRNGISPTYFIYKLKKASYLSDVK